MTLQGCEHSGWLGVGPLGGRAPQPLSTSQGSMTPQKVSLATVGVSRDVYKCWRPHREFKSDLGQASWKRPCFGQVVQDKWTFSRQRGWEQCLRQRHQQHVGRPRKGREPCSIGPGLK